MALRYYETGTPVSVGEAFVTGLKNWPRMWWTRFLTNLLLVLSLLLLVVPCFYLFPRLALTDSVVVSERLSGGAAMKRSRDLVRGRHWQTVGLLLLLLLIMCVPIGVMIGLSAFEVLPEHWVADAAMAVASDVLAAFDTVCLCCIYKAFSQPVAGAAESSPQTMP